MRDKTGRDGDTSEIKYQDWWNLVREIEKEVLSGIWRKKSGSLKRVWSTENERDCRCATLSLPSGYSQRHVGHIDSSSHEVKKCVIYTVSLTPTRAHSKHPISGFRECKWTLPWSQKESQSIRTRRNILDHQYSHLIGKESAQEHTSMLW